MGRYFQVIFQNYVNENLLNPKGLHAEFTPETEKQTEQYKHMNRQSKLSKDKRDFSFHTKRLENIKIQIAQTKELHDLLANDTMKLKETKNHLLI
ncbi:hypothetical protein [Vibrio furnissii]|uniref:hypothetical protein n=1 Tax=Vibrio furnissii TaxID=29494 RepID=UPI001EEA3FB7|nr:hypothetical protein [Vibrio furnissii]MCG6231513.1 hypothetical protein [Vibrio furnissii]MCG6261438.1 hypothetical protein [Vibrio furnissii]